MTIDFMMQKVEYTSCCFAIKNLIASLLCT